MMKVLIFGTGNFYKKYKDWFRSDISIVGFLDNSIKKTGKLLDGKTIYAPCAVHNLKYDFIFLLSSYYMEMRQQLISLGISSDVIYDINHMEKICRDEENEFNAKILIRDEKTNIVLFSPGFSFSGAQNAMVKLIDSLGTEHFNMIVASSEDGILRKTLKAKGVQPILIRDINRNNRQFIQLLDWADIIWVNTAWLYSVVYESLDFGKKIFWWIHESGPIKYIATNYWEAYEKCMELRILSVSPIVNRLLTDLLNSQKVLDLRYGLKEYDIGKKKRPNGKTVFAVIGDISFIKAQDIFIQAAKLVLKKSIYSVEFWIIGRGDCSRLQAETKDIEEIKFQGEISNDKMPEIYRNIDVLVSCSREDAMPIVVTEALMNQKAVIVSDCIGTAIYIQDKLNGLIVQTGSIEALYNAMIWVLDHPRQSVEIGRRGYEIYKEYFTLERFETDVARIINGI